MKHFLGLVILLSVLSACRKESLDSKTSRCQNAAYPYERTSEVHLVSTTVRAAVMNNQPINEYWIYPSDSRQVGPLTPCNLPIEFQKDSLKVKISGYMLSFPGMEYMDLTAFPFEVTEIQLAK